MKNLRSSVVRTVSLIVAFSVAISLQAQQGVDDSDSAVSVEITSLEQPAAVDSAMEIPVPIEDLALEAFVDGLLATWRSVHDAPGYTVSVVRPDRTVFAKGYGMADLENNIPVDPENTRFYVASISKTFLFTAVMVLVERGELDLDSDVNGYLKRYQVPEGERPLTLNDLMAHRGGFEENLTIFISDVASLDLPDAMAITEPRQVFPRGEVVAYSNWGTNLMALVIEDATGRSYEDFLFAEILEPLGMSTTALDENSPAAQSPSTPTARNYRVKASGPEVVEQKDLGAFAPIGGMSTTAADMARWMRFHLGRGELDGVRLMSEATYELSRTRNFDPVPGAAGRTHGFADLPYRSSHYYGHTGSINAFFSKFSIAPELGLGVFISQNTQDSFDPLSATPKLVFDRELSLRGDPDVSVRPAPSEEDIAAAEELAGDYIASRRVFHGIEKAMGTLEVATLTASEGQLMGSSTNSPYVQIVPDVWENRHGDRLGVIRNAEGGVLRLISSSGSNDLVPVTPLTNPKLMFVAIGATLLFSITAWLGLFRRWGRDGEANGRGRLLSALVLWGAAPIVWMLVVLAGMPGPSDMSFVEVFDEWPIPEMKQLGLAATLASVVALLGGLGLMPAWKGSGWPLKRKLNYTLFALAYLSAVGMFINWGLAPYLP